MRQIWIQEVRYYKYLAMLCILLFGLGLFLLHDHQQRHNNTNGIIVNVIFIQNVSNIIPVYKVQQNNVIFNVYDKCICNSYKNCSNLPINNNIYFEKVVGCNSFDNIGDKSGTYTNIPDSFSYYVISDINQIPLFFGWFAISFSFCTMLCLLYAYCDFFNFMRKERRLVGHSKKSDLPVYVQDLPKSYLYD
jgi:hypothetical protein